MEETARLIAIQRIKQRLERLYPGRGDECLARLRLLAAMYMDRFEEQFKDRDPQAPLWDQRDVMLITYGDSVRCDGEAPLATLARFLREQVGDCVSTVHILPFFPFSSDDGFSVIDYLAVNFALGGWEDIEEIGKSHDMMFDLVLNHCSKMSTWFREYLQGLAPARDYFHEVEPFTDLSQVVRPRQSPLLTEVQTRRGPKLVWTTFSEDQVDLNFANPDVLLDFLNILASYVSHGARFIRLDAIAYLWKQIGTTCIHLPQTHEVVKLMRDALDLMAPHVILLTETNVPHQENISYFGQGDEARMVYNFTLPPLLLHALQTGSGQYLTRWAQDLSEPPAGCTYFNFTASHDGIGVRPLEGVVPDGEIKRLTSLVKTLGGHVSEKSNADGSTSPYELNITWFAAMARPGDDGQQAELQYLRFICSQTIALAMRGIPGVYIHCLLATGNDHRAVEELGYARAINRHKWREPDLAERLADPFSIHKRVFDEYQRRLRLRQAQPAFHPDGPQHVLDLGDSVFAVKRLAPNDGHTLLSLNNLTEAVVHVDAAHAAPVLASGRCVDLLSEQPINDPGRIELQPYQSIWLVAEDADEG